MNTIQIKALKAELIEKYINGSITLDEYETAIELGLNVDILDYKSGYSVGQKNEITSEFASVLGKDNPSWLRGYRDAQKSNQ